MARQLKASVMVGSQVYEAGSEPPADIAEQITNADAWADSDEKPAKSALKPEWEAYARTQGATDVDLEGKSKDDLIATYGG